MTQNGAVCLPAPALLFFIFRFEDLISGPKRYRDFRETGPWSFWKIKSINYVAINKDFGTEDLLRGCKIIRLFMLHVPLHITKVIDVGRVLLWVSSV